MQCAENKGCFQEFIELAPAKHAGRYRPHSCGYPFGPAFPRSTSVNLPAVGMSLRSVPAMLSKAARAGGSQVLLSSPPKGEWLVLLWGGRMVAWLPGLLLVLLLTGCITHPKPTPIPPIDAIEREGDRLIWLHSHPDWSFTGRVALRQQGKGGSGRIEWQQQGARYRIRLSAPVTRQSWQLIGDLAAGHARIEGIEGGPLQDTDAEALLQDATGWDIPVHSLADWVRGTGHTVGRDDAEGRPQPFERAGWRVTYQLWHPATATLPSLPKRIEAVRVDGGADAPRIRLLIDRWEFP